MRKITPILLAGLALLGLGAAAQPEKARNSVAAGEFIVDAPTLINLGFEWVITGDDNRNARVAVSYRRKGDTEWKPALPLTRLQHEQIYWGDAREDDHVLNVTVPNMFAGSIMDLEPDTTYEARFALTDPDGVKGKAVHIATVKTRAEPKPFAGGRIIHAYPPGWKGPREPNSWIGLNCAYNYHCHGGDESLSDRPRVVAGDTILLHAGVYPSWHDYYSRQSSTRPVEGTYYLFGQGTAEKPIVMKAAGDGEVIFDGRGNFNLFNMAGSKYNYFEGITFRNTDIAIQGGVQFIGGAIGLTVKHSKFENINIGVNDSWSQSRDFYIADNSFIGRDDPKHLQGWNGEVWDRFNGVDGQEFPAKLKSYTAVRVYGQGHVVAYNYVANFHDGIDVETYGNPDGTDAVKGPFYPPRALWDRRTVSVDFYNNYITNMHDNSIEIDGSMHNIRVMRNMLINSASHPFCNQPSIGGPVYWIRNIAYNAPFGAARITNGAPGIWFINNTIFSEFAANQSGNLRLFNNLILGQNGSPAVYAVNSYTSYGESDHNGFKPNDGAKASFTWASPPAGMQRDYRDLYNPDFALGRSANPASQRTLVTQRFATLADYAARTGRDTHSILVDYGDFENVKPLNAKDLTKLQMLYDARDMDFRLRPGAAPVDKGVALPNVADVFTGSAPDLGAVESGQPLPHYGPRP